MGGKEKKTDFLSTDLVMKESRIKPSIPKREMLKVHVKRYQIYKTQQKVSNYNRNPEEYLILQGNNVGEPQRVKRAINRHPFLLG